MAAIIPPKGGATPTYRTIRVGKKSLKLTVYDNTETITIFLGGHDLFCIDAFFYTPESTFAKYGMDFTRCTLSHIYHNLACSLEHNFQKGVDTKMILHLLISYVKTHYPYIRTISFNDTSFRTCENGAHVELTDMSFIRTGKTWYEAHFHAYVEEPYAAKFHQAEISFQERKKIYTWGMMKSYIISDLPIKEEDMKNRFESAATWQDFFGPLSEEIGMAEFCTFVAPWLHRFLHTNLDFAFSFAQYSIPIDKIEAIAFTESAYMRGGKRFTRRALRIPPMNFT